MTAPQLFRKRPVVIEAMQWTGGPESAAPIVAWVLDSGGHARYDTGINGKELLHVRTLEGLVFASPGDWIVKGVESEFYPVKPSIFEATYEAVSTDGREETQNSLANGATTGGPSTIPFAPADVPAAVFSAAGMSVPQGGAA